MVAVDTELAFYSYAGANVVAIVLIPPYRIYFLGDAISQLYLGLGGMAGYLGLSVGNQSRDYLTFGAVAQAGYKFDFGGFFLETYVGLTYQTVYPIPLALRYGASFGFFL